MTGLLYAHIMAELLEDVRRGQLRAGSRVPGELELARRFSVSRITSRRALDILAQTGIVERSRGKGTFVSATLPDLDRVRADLGLAPPRHRVGTATIGLLLPDFAAAYGIDLVRGVEEACTSRGHLLLLRRTYGERAQEEAGVPTLMRAGANALIVFPVHGEHYNPVLLQAVLDGFPIVLVDRYLRGIPAPSVATDNVAAAHALTTHLLELGHRDIAFVSSAIENTSSLEERFAGYRAALEAANLPARPDLALHALRSNLPLLSRPENVRTDVARLASFIEEARGVTAFLVAEYNLALAVTHALRTLGRRVPEDVSVVCFDSPTDPLGEPPFTHVSQDQAEMGRRAVELAVARLEGEDVPLRNIVAFDVVKGRSSAPPRATKD